MALPDRGKEVPERLLTVAAVLLFARGVRKMERALPAAMLREKLPKFLSVSSLLIFPASSNLSSLLCSSL